MKSVMVKRSIICSKATMIDSYKKSGFCKILHIFIKSIFLAYFRPLKKSKFLADLRRITLRPCVLGHGERRAEKWTRSSHFAEVTEEGIHEVPAVGRGEEYLKADFFSGKFPNRAQKSPYNLTKK